MTWRLLTCSSLLCAIASGAAVTGTVRLSGTDRRDRSGVVIWLEPAGAGDSAVGIGRARARMEQRGKRFIPHVVAIQAGSEVEFPNDDPIFHNAFSNFSGQVFDLGLYAPGDNRAVRFTRPGVVRVFCNIHPSMSAVIVVLRHPWFAVSNRAGAFKILDVAPGEYELRVFHERATEATLEGLVRRITVGNVGMALAPLEISETGWVETPHKNKYGREYPPETEQGYKR